LAIAADGAMNEATLEVRVSNEPARALYRAYGFHDVGLRKRYYEDNGEDAVIMTTEAFSSDGFRDRYGRLRSELAARYPALFADGFEPGGWGF
jgi:ribosomal-protein-alanine N-acetyltransferase